MAAKKIDGDAKTLEEEFYGAELRFLRWYDSPVDMSGKGAPPKMSTWTQAQAVQYLRMVRQGASSYQMARALGVNRHNFHAWRRKGRTKGRASRPTLYRLFYLATEAAEGRAVADCEAAVRISNPLAWLARRARSHPGYVGWEPEATKIDLGGQADNPLEVHGKIDADEVRNEEAKRLGAAIGVLKELGLMTEQNLTGAAPVGDGEDEDEEFEDE